MVTREEEDALQDLFCPVLDAPLVLSVLHDLQDFDKAVELLGTLRAESIPDVSGPGLFGSAVEGGQDDEEAEEEEENDDDEEEEGDDADAPEAEGGQREAGSTARSRPAGNHERLPDDAGRPPPESRSCAGNQRPARRPVSVVSTGTSADAASTACGSVASFRSTSTTLCHTLGDAASTSSSVADDQNDDAGSPAAGASSPSGWQLDLLVNMLPHMPRSQIEAALEACGGDISHAARVLIPANSVNATSAEDYLDPGHPGEAETATWQQTALPRPRGLLSEEFDASLSYLASVFPDLPIDAVRRHLELANGNREHAVSIILALDARGRSGGGSHGAKSIVLAGQKPFASAADAPTEGPQKKGRSRRRKKKRQDGCQPVISLSGPSLMPSSPASALVADDQAEASVDVPEEKLDPDSCRFKAAQLFKERNEAFRKAATAYRSGNAVGIGKGRILSSYFSDEGHRLNRLAKLWEVKAATAKIEQQLKAQGNSSIVDLHGLTTAEALPIVRRLTERWWNQAGQPKNSAPLTFICGRGIHSLGGVARLFPAVAKDLVESGWDVSLEELGCVVVKRKLPK